MIWPEWEAGFSEVLMWTLLPLGYLAHIGKLPNTTWMISGVLRTRSWEPLVRMSRGVCTFERNDFVEDTAVTEPLPRCPESACFERLALCRLHHAVSHRKSWIGRARLDVAIGIAPLPLPELDQLPWAAREAQLHVLVARRRSHHGRHLTNAHELIAACATAPLGRTRVICRHVDLSEGPLTQTVRTLRDADVLLGMHGGELINALHMPPGRTVIELVSHGFHTAPREWLDHYWLHLTPVLRHKRIVIPPPDLDQPTRSFLHAWNADATLPLELLWQVLRAVVDDDDDLPTPDCPSMCFGHVASARNVSSSERTIRAAVRRIVSPGSVASFMADARTGYCARTSFAPHDACSFGKQPSGSWTLSEAVRDGPQRLAVEQCLRLCAACSRCAYVSISRHLADCSWFVEGACDLAQLHTDHVGFVSARAVNHVSTGSLR